jgi:hypothetical protein
MFILATDYQGWTTAKVAKNIVKGNSSFAGGDLPMNERYFYAEEVPRASHE